MGLFGIMPLHIVIWDDMAFSANDKMLMQLSCTKKVRRVQIRTQIKNMEPDFFVIFKFLDKIIAQVFK